MNAQGLLAKQGILSALISLGGPSTLTEISNAANFFPQRVKYHLPQLIEIGMITKQVVGDSSLYALQEIQYQDQRSAQLHSALGSIYDSMISELDFSQSEVEPLIVVVNNLNLLIEALLAQIAKAHGLKDLLD